MITTALTAPKKATACPGDRRSFLLHDDFKMGIFLHCVPEYPTETTAPISGILKVQQRQAGILGNGGEQVVKRVQVMAVPVGESKRFCKRQMHQPGGIQRSAVNGNLFHQGSP